MTFDHDWNAFNVAQESLRRSVDLRVVRSSWSGMVRLEGTLLHDGDAIRFSIDEWNAPKEWR